MKLRNKKTGEIRNAVDIDMYTDSVYLKVSNGEFDNETIEYHSLAELNEEWEDYEEPKDHWYINYQGEVYVLDPKAVPEYSRNAKAIGNYFDTKEEAEKAVEKLKAIKILKDYDLHIEWANTPEYDENEDRWYCSVDFSVREGCDGDNLFNLLFGGEE